MPNGASICPSCDYIIDSSFLEKAAVPPDADDEETTHKPAPPRSSGSKPATGVKQAVPPRSSAQRPAPRTSGSAPRPAQKTGTRPQARPAGPRTSAPQAMTETEMAAPAVRPPPREPPKPSVIPTDTNVPRANSGIQMVAPEEALEDVKRFVSDLPSSDKLAFIGAVIVILVSFLPWKDTAAEGEVLGLMSLGFFAFAAALVTIFAIIVRVRRVMPRLNPLVPWLVQLGSICFAIVWCFIFIRISWNGQRVASPIGNFERAISTPSFGVVLGLIGNFVALGGTLMGLKEKPA